MARTRTIPTIKIDPMRIQLSVITFIFFFSYCRGQVLDTLTFWEYAEEVETSVFRMQNEKLWLKFDQGYFTLSNSNNEQIFGNAFHWSYVIGVYHNSNDSIICEVKEMYSFSTNTGLISFRKDIFPPVILKLILSDSRTLQLKQQEVALAFLNAKVYLFRKIEKGYFIPPSISQK